MMPMDEDQRFDINDISNFEANFKEKIDELQWKSKALQELQQEVFKIRQELVSKDILLEDRKRTINDLRMQLTTANHVVEMIEREKSKCANERMQSQINCDTAMKERESLLEQAHKAKLENMTLKLELQKKTEDVAQNEIKTKKLEASLVEVQNRFFQTNSFLKSSISKLEREHKSLKKTIGTVINLNKQLQTVGLCSLAIYEKKNEEIRELQRNLAGNGPQVTTQLQVQGEEVIHISGVQRQAKDILEQIRFEMRKYSESDQEIDAILREFGK
ncbi:hypothetical protein QAD02_004186 [Eretmocerus hayati]|uniref:Uncharacterized protein n=1 Tax=Eretmocerus hayati TaxID=131215 RepID=A0ACC2NNU6_9HYME|nr:hypothetical protein QAD02_004186 [Eretmocerus hayati]